MKQSFISRVFEEINVLLLYAIFYPISSILDALHFVIHALMKVNAYLALSFFKYGCPGRSKIRNDMKMREEEDAIKARNHFLKSMKAQFGDGVTIDPDTNTIKIYNHGESETEDEDGVPSSPSRKDQETEQAN